MATAAATVVVGGLLLLVIAHVYLVDQVHERHAVPNWLVSAAGPPIWEFGVYWVATMLLLSGYGLIRFVAWRWPRARREDEPVITLPDAWAVVVAGLAVVLPAGVVFVVHVTTGSELAGHVAELPLLFGAVALLPVGPDGWRILRVWLPSRKTSRDQRALPATRWLAVAVQLLGLIAAFLAAGYWLGVV
jgi:hypothetical protein